MNSQYFNKANYGATLIFSPEDISYILIKIVNNLYWINVNQTKNESSEIKFVDEPWDSLLFVRSSIVIVWTIANILSLFIDCCTTEVHQNFFFFFGEVWLSYKELRLVVWEHLKYCKDECCY